MNIWLLAVILGLIEGITEFIPVSSTGHLLLAGNFLGVREHAPFLTSELFNAFIQCWALLAALPLFRERLATLRRWREPLHRDYFLKLGLALGITIAGALVMKTYGLELRDSALPIVAALAVGGVTFILVERWLHGRNTGTEITWKIAAVIGLAQLLAVAFPGTSRSGATILLALMLGLARPAATEFSFLLGVPTLGAAGAKTLFDAWRNGGSRLPDGVTVVPIEWAPMLLASGVAALSSFFAVRWLLGYVRTHSFAGFGWYRIALAAVIAVFLSVGWMH